MKTKKEELQETAQEKIKRLKAIELKIQKGECVPSKDLNELWDFKERGEVLE